MNKLLSYSNYKIIIAIAILIVIILVMGWIIFYKLDSPVVEVRYIDRVIREKEVEYIEVENEVYLYQFKATGYSPNDPAQGTTRTMASGKEVYIGAVAVDPDVIPLGTQLEITGLPNGWDGIYIAEDIGGAIKQNRLDIFRELKSEAMQINCWVWVHIID
jgi:3D (Asp-Asp-Asp) domain-containing protein